MTGKSRKRKQNKASNILLLPIAVIAVLAAFLFLIIILRSGHLHHADETSSSQISESSSGFIVKIETETTASETEEETEEQPNENGYYEKDFEKNIYSYVQCHAETYNGDPKWTGNWSHITAGGQEFHNFGCGICCLSNIYSTLTDDEADPSVMYQWAKEYVGYNPDSGVGAMSWSQLKNMCEKLGLGAEVKKKSDYSTFQRDLYGADAAIILVCKDNDKKYWWYTNGHYVTLWAYDPAEDSVFISDPSGLFNRVRVHLKDLYKALKTSSDAQYMLVRK